MCAVLKSQRFNAMIQEIISRLETIESYSRLAAKNVLTMDEAAIIMGLRKTYLYKLVSAHKIPYYKPSGKQLYFDRKEIEDWMRQNRVPTNAETEQKAIAYVASHDRKGGKK